MSGHFFARLNGGLPVPDFQFGISYYSSVFPLESQPTRGSQLGWGSWLIPDNRSFTQPLCPVGTYARDNWPERGPTYRDVYQTIEGGIGQWTTTRFPSSRPKFRPNSTPDCYSAQLASPGWEFYTTPLQHDKLGFAQVSNRLLLPPDGVTLDPFPGTTVLGYGWLALPLISASTSTRGVPTGDQSWTLFLNASNFSGPVAFFTPATWSAINAVDRTGVGRGHDARPAFHGQVALEIGNLPMFTAGDASGVRYRRVPRLTFPVDGNGEAVLLRNLRYYSKEAAWDGVADWIANGTSVTEFRESGSFTPKIDARGLGVRLGGQDVFPNNDFDATHAEAGGEGAFGLRWGGTLEPGVFPEYYVESGGVWRSIPASEVPPETRLAEQIFPAASGGTIEGLDISESSPWRSSAWSAGPFTSSLNDGSTVDYVWYRFVDQPAIALLGLDAATLASLQAWVESLHETSGAFGVSFAPPASGTLATIDTEGLVLPPAGLETGYVPIVIRQY